MKIQITGPTDVTGDNARYTLELSELTPGDYTLTSILTSTAPSRAAST